jgi:hypothetical protein
LVVKTDDRKVARKVDQMVVQRVDGKDDTTAVLKVALSAALSAGDWACSLAVQRV